MSLSEPLGFTTMPKKVYRIASIPADGIGPEVVAAGITVLKRLASTLGTFDLHIEQFDWNSDYYKKHGTYLPDDALSTLKSFDAILFGAVGAPGKYKSFTLYDSINELNDRCSGSYLTMGTPPRHLSTAPTIRQRATGKSAPRDPEPAPQTRQLGLGHHPRKLRGRVRGTRGTQPRGKAVGSVDRGVDLFATWSRTHHVVCV